MREEYDIVKDRRTVNHHLLSGRSLIKVSIYLLVVISICVLLFNITYFYTLQWYSKNDKLETSEQSNIGNIMGKTYQIEQKLKKDLEKRRIK